MADGPTASGYQHEERSAGGWCGCAALLPFPVVFMVALEEAIHRLDGTEWLVFWLVALVVPVLVFQSVKLIINKLVRLLGPRNQ